MSSVAEQLRQAREAQKLDVYQVAEATKIRTDHIRALEEGDYDRFVAPVYIRGFARTYATLLKMDVPAFMADLDAELRLTKRFAEPPALTKPGGGPLDLIMLQLSRVNWRIAVGLLLLLLLVLGGALAVRTWQEHKKSNPLDRLGSGLHHVKGDPSLEYLPSRTNAPKR